MEWQAGSKGQPPWLVQPCPDCGQPLVLRTNRLTQESFLGCSLYPRCVHTEPLSEYHVKVARGDPRLPGF